MSALIASVAAGSWPATIALLAFFALFAFVGWLAFRLICYGVLGLVDDVVTPQLCDSLELGPGDKLIAVHNGPIGNPEWVGRFVRDTNAALEKFLDGDKRAAAFPRGPWSFVVVRRTAERGEVT